MSLTLPCPHQTGADPPAQSTFVSNGQPLFHHEPLLTSCHCSTDPAKVTRSRDSQYQKAEDPMLVTLSGMTIEVREVQSENALLPMLVTPSGMVIEVREVLPEKA